LDVNKRANPQSGIWNIRKACTDDTTSEKGENICRGLDIPEIPERDSLVGAASGEDKLAVRVETQAVHL